MNLGFYYGEIPGAHLHETFQWSMSHGPCVTPWARPGAERIKRFRLCCVTRKHMEDSGRACHVAIGVANGAKIARDFHRPGIFFRILH
jgi:hypothetical protein